MIKVHFTSALKRFFHALESLEVEAHTIPELIEKVEAEYPGMQSFLLEDSGELRKHVNVFVGENLASLEDELGPDVKEVFIFQALSGG